MSTQTIVGPTGAFAAKWALESGLVKKPLIKMMAFIKGPVGSGKSSALASLPKTLIIDDELKTCHIPTAHWGPGTQRYTLKQSGDSLAKLEELVSDLAQMGAKGQAPFEAVAFDTADELLFAHTIPCMTARVLAHKAEAIPAYGDVCDFGQKGKGWFLVTNTIMAMLRQLRNTGYGVWVTGHEKEERVGDTIRFRYAVPDGLSSAIKRMAEIKGTALIKTVTEKTPTKVKVGDKEIMQLVSRDVTTASMTLQTNESERDDASSNNLGLPKKIVYGPGEFWKVLDAAYNAEPPVS